MNSPNLKQVYLTKLKSLIERTFSLANRNALSEADLRQKASDWEFIINEKIPFERLDDAFRQAYEIRNNSKDGFLSGQPLQAHELTYSWVIIQRNRVGRGDGTNCPTQHLEAVDSPSVMVLNFDYSEDVLMPCPLCRREQFNEIRAKQKQEFIKNNPDTELPQLQELLELFKNFSGLHTQKPTTATAENILSDLIIQTQKQMMVEVGEEFISTRNGWKKLFNARKYLKNPFDYEQKKSEFRRLKRLENNLKQDSGK